MLLSSSLTFAACISVQAQEQESDRAYIEETLNLANNEEQEWTYSPDTDAWVLSVVSAVAYPELPDQQGVSVCVPGAYVTGIDADGDGTADVTSENVADAVKGSLVIDYEAELISTNGQVYTAATAPVILNTGAAGYGSQNNSKASASYAADGYINVSCGNRGKQDSITDEAGNTVYTGDAPSCLADQKAAARYVKYNILLGNIPGNVNYIVSTGGSGGGAHAAMFAATSNNSDYYDYQIEAGAVGVYKNEDGSYSTTVNIDGTDYELSDGAWGCIAYSAITSLYEADMALAFEYNLDPEYSFKTKLQAQLAEYLSERYMEYINGQNLSVEESAVGFDLSGEEKAAAFIEGRYTKSSSGSMMGGMPGGMGAETKGDLPDGEIGGRGELKGELPDGMKGGRAGGMKGNLTDGELPDNELPGEMEVGTPEGGTTQSSSGSGADSSNYAAYEEMVAA